jgi:hypothetical protein
MRLFRFVLIPRSNENRRRAQRTPAHSCARSAFNDSSLFSAAAIPAVYACCSDSSGQSISTPLPCSADNLTLWPFKSGIDFP